MARIDLVKYDGRSGRDCQRIAFAGERIDSAFDITLPHLLFDSIPTGVYYRGQSGIASALKESLALAHVIRDKNKLLNRVRRIKGQVDAVERSLKKAPSALIFCTPSPLAGARSTV